MLFEIYSLGKKPFFGKTPDKVSQVGYCILISAERRLGVNGNSDGIPGGSVVWRSTAANAVSVQCLCSVCAVSVQCLCSVCAVSVQCLCSVCAVSVQCLCSVCAVSVQCLCSVCAVSVQCLCSVEEAQKGTLSTHTACTRLCMTGLVTSIIIHDCYIT